MRSEGLRHVLAAAGCALAAAALVHLGAEALARWAERCLGAHLWWKEEQLSLLEPSRYGPAERPRLFVYGSSDVREATDEAVLEAELSGVDARGEAHSLATRSDVLRYLELLERAHGPQAFPEHLVIGWSPRMLADVGARGSALGGAVDRYAPGFRVAPPGAPAALEPKGLAASLASRWRALLHRRARYRNGVRAFVRAWPPPLACFDRDLGPPLRRATYRHLPPLSERRVAEILADLDPFWRRPHTFDFDAERAAILADLGRIGALCERHGVALYNVTLPERAAYRAMYAPGTYEAFVALLEEGLPDAPFLDLRTLLSDADFFDHVHASAAGAVAFSRAMAELVGKQHGR